LSSVDVFVFSSPELVDVVSVGFRNTASGRAFASLLGRLLISLSACEETSLLRELGD
jgi:hypothetical protein